MKRYKKLVFEAEENIIFEVSEGTRGELIVRANIATASVYNKNYLDPPIPERYKHICGKWYNGFVIERCSDGSQFVWIPVGSLDPNGTLDGVFFTERFGRRNYRNSEFSDGGFHEALEGELALQFESIKKYGGFYISRYNISKNRRTGKPQSVKGEKPWTGINFNVAKRVVSTLERTDTLTSHLTFGAEYDSVLEWFIESKARTFQEITENSTKWGNHWNTNKSLKKLAETGSCEEWCTNNIYDFAGNVEEWTQERYNRLYSVIRGGDFGLNGEDFPVANRCYGYPINCYNYIGFRATLYIK